MKTYILDLIPKLQQFSRRLDETALLVNQHWVVIDEITNSKNVYIFRSNNELLISHNGKVEKAKWEYLGNNSLLIDRKEESYLFKQGFFDEYVLALKVDSKNEYAILINENKYDGELNSIERILDFLNTKYIEKNLKSQIKENIGLSNNIINKTLFEDKYQIIVKSNKGEIVFSYSKPFSYPIEDCMAFIDDELAPDGEYKLGFMHYVKIKNGIVIKVSLLGKFEL